MAHPLMFDDADPVLGRLRAITLALPDADEKVSHGSPAFFTTKVFAYFGGSEKLADGGHVRHAHSLLVLADPVEREALLQGDRGYLPMYLGPAGWIGYDLPEAGTDDQEPEDAWAEAAELVETSYRLTAGVRRVRRLDERG